MAWTDVGNDETGFMLQRRELNGVWSAWLPLGVAAANTLTYQDNAAGTEWKHQYRLQSCNHAGCSDLVKSAAVLAEVAPAAPTSATVSQTGADILTITFADNSHNETSFEIQRRQESTSGVWTSFAPLATVGQNTIETTDVTTAAGTRYQYRVRAANAAGRSTWALTTRIVRL